MHLIKDGFKDYKLQLSKAIDSLHQLTTEIDHKPLMQTVKEIKDHINDPFLFVIVGEVKAGKSSFVNALLGTKEEICKVAASPMTDTIQQIVYGEKTEEIDINPYLKRITHPVEILKEIAIVDTPGTNTIIDHHQEITERFIPHADLIVFVFEAKNPYRQSSWEFFNYINEAWRKKIIFVLQQKDLMEPDDLVVNIEGVKSQAIQKGIPDPNVFDVSAKMELEDQAGSGFESLKAYIQKNITGGKAPYLKLLNNSTTAQTINLKIGESLTLREEQWKLDQAFRDEIKSTLDHQGLKTEKQIDFLVENLLASYNKITQETDSELSNGLSFVTMIKKSFSSLFSTNEGPKEWLQRLTKDFEQRLNISLKDKLQNGVIDIADNIQMMAKLVDSQVKSSPTVLLNSDEIFADIAEKRANILKELQLTFADFMSNSENFYDKAMLHETENMAPNLAAGSGIAVIGVILATVVNGAVFDITGGILTTIGLLFAGVSVGFKRRKILQGYRQEIVNGRTQLESEVTEKLKSYTAKIKTRIDSNFAQFDKHLSDEGSKINTLGNQRKEIDNQLNTIKNTLDKVLSK